MANENQTTVLWTQSTWEKETFLSKVRWFFQKSKDNWGNAQNKRLTKAFHLTRKDSLVSGVIALIVVWWALYYWKVVYDEYTTLNSRSDDLKNFATYNISTDSEKLYWYAETDKIETIDQMIEINDRINEEIKENDIRKQQQKSYYEVLLQNIYLPSLNVWKDPYTKDFDMAVLWQKYLETDKFQDLYLIQYWSDFAKGVWNDSSDASYNSIDKITIWDKVVLKDNPEYFYTPITIEFSSPNKRSFLLLVNKLSMTSNQKNISLVNEFFLRLLETIREEKSDVVNQLAEEYRERFSSSYNWDLLTDYEELKKDEEMRSIYRDRVIWYNLYHRISDDWVLSGDTELIDDDVIVSTIKRVTLCQDEDSTQECFYNFREKYRNLPYLAYNVWLEIQEDRTAGLYGFLQDLPPAIAITDFGFEKFSDSSFLNNKEEEYQWEVTFNAYGRNILDSELEEASIMLWKLCFWNTSDQQISPDLALNRVNDTISSYGWERDGKSEYKNMSSLWELQRIFEWIQKNYDKMSNYDKMIKLFEIRRMMNDANLCNK